MKFHMDVMLKILNSLKSPNIESSTNSLNIIFCWLLSNNLNLVLPFVVEALAVPVGLVTTNLVV